MPSVDISWEATETTMPQGSPDDDHFLVTLDGPNHYEVEAALTATSATIQDVEPGMYVAGIQTIGIDGSNVGEAAKSESFEVADLRVRVMIPSNVRGNPGV